MTSLKEYQFCKLYAMSSGISSKPEQAGHGAPFASFSTIFNNHFLPENLCDFMDTSEKEQETYSIKKGDIFLTRTSETIDELGMSCVALKDYPKATFSGFVKRLRPTQVNLTYAKYMGFYLRSKFFRKTMTNNAIMTLRASLNEEIYSYLKLYLPDYKTQQKIGDFLFLLNSKIEINHRINNKLLLMAKILYNYWFVQFDFPDKNGNPYKTSGGKMTWSKKLNRKIPVDWNVEMIKDVSTVIMGQSPKGESYNEIGSGIPLINGPADYVNGSLYARTYTTKPTRLCKKDDLVFCIRATIGNLTFAEREFCLGRGVAAVRPNNKDASELLFYSLLQEIERFKTHATGSIIIGITKDDLTDSFFIQPPNDLVKKFHAIANPIFNQQRVNKTENQNLAELRDWLLPMLMNGQVRVTDYAESKNSKASSYLANGKPQVHPKSNPKVL